MNETDEKAISKVLSANDTGETGGHQAGILIPKEEGVLSFFPRLGVETKNPRMLLRLTDQFGQVWKFNFIYYNNRFFGGTRNEFRLTGMTSYIRQNNLIAGDTIVLKRLQDNRLEIYYRRQSDDNQINKSQDNILRLGSSWKVIKI